MINLLPPDTKSAYRYARSNRVLLRWCITCVLALTGAILITSGGYIYLNQSITNTSKQIADTNKQLKAEHLSSIQKQASTISDNLKLAVRVLSQEVLFSKLLKQLATVMPANAILTNLTIAQIQGGVDITAQTTNYQAATQLQLNLADPKNQIFSKADIVNVTCGASTTAAMNSNYPCVVTLRALFANNSQFLFINNKQGGSS